MPGRTMQEGRYYEDFGVGDTYEHSHGRTITDADDVWFSNLTMNTNPIRIDYAHAAQKRFRKPLVNSTFTLALPTGMSVVDVSQNTFANLGWDRVQLPNPLFVGDTLYEESEVLEKRESRTRADVGIVINSG